MLFTHFLVILALAIVASLGALLGVRRAPIDGVAMREVAAPITVIVVAAVLVTLGFLVV